MEEIKDEEFTMARVRVLVKAGALIAAEVDRLQRKALGVSQERGRRR
jgi:hypothetical protein